MNLKSRRLEMDLFSKMDDARLRIRIYILMEMYERKLSENKN
jgi:hypothetical protein